MEATSAPTKLSTPNWIWIVGVLLVAVVIYVIYTFLEWNVSGLRLSRTLGAMNSTFKGLMHPASVSGCAAAGTSGSATPGGGNDYKVCDYYIASSAKSVYPSGQVFDYISADTVTTVLGAGARFLDLDVFLENGQPVVAAENATMRFRQSFNKVYLVDVLKNIAAAGWKSSSDPLFIGINAADGGADTTLWNNIAAVIRASPLVPRLLDSSFSYERKNIAQTPICALLGKVVIVSGGAYKGTDFEEFVNLSWTGAYMRRLTLTQAEETYSHEELTDWNRQNLTLVVPDPARSLANKSADLCLAWGCQFVAMHYSVPDEPLADYLKTFENQALVLKPDSLRAITPTYPEPVPQVDVKRFTPIKLTNKFFSAQI